MSAERTAVSPFAGAPAGSAPAAGSAAVGGPGAGAAARLLAEVAAVAEGLGDRDAAQRLRDEAGQLASRAARVVVVGEKKRGKSSLINALLGRPGLLPVDADIATSVHVSVQSADREQAAVVTDSSPDGREIPLPEVGSYAALDPATGDMRHPDVREVSVGLPDPLLRAGLVLIDTPGVGGLVSGHAALTLAALGMADALLFVVNGSSELTASECAFLGQATERVATVVFALTQTDKYPAWQDVLARNHVLIAQHAPQFADAPWFAVSSRLRVDAVRAAAVGNAERAAGLEQRSGFASLRETLTGTIAGRAGELRAINAVWTARRVLDVLIAGQEQRLRSLAKDPGLIAAITEQRALLNKCRSADPVWRRNLDKGFRELSRELDLLYRRLLANLQITADQWVADADTATVTQISHDLDAGVRALWAELESAAEQGAARIAAEIAAELDASGVDALAADVPYPEQLRELPGLRLSGDQKAGGAVAMLSRYFPGVSMTSLAAHYLLIPMGVAVNPFLLIPTGLMVGHLLYQNRHREEQRVRARADVQRHVRAVLTHVGAVVPAAILDGVEQMRTAIAQAISDRMRDRDEQLQTAITQSSQHLEASEQELAPQREATEETLRRLRDLATTAVQLTSPGLVR